MRGARERSKTPIIHGIMTEGKKVRPLLTSEELNSPIEPKRLIGRKDIAIEPAEKTAEHKETVCADRTARDFPCAHEQAIDTARSHD